MNSERANDIQSKLLLRRLDRGLEELTTIRETLVNALENQMTSFHHELSALEARLSALEARWEDE